MRLEINYKIKLQKIHKHRKSKQYAAKQVNHVIFYFKEEMKKIPSDKLNEYTANNLTLYLRQLEKEKPTKPMVEGEK